MSVPTRLRVLLPLLLAFAAVAINAHAKPSEVVVIGDSQSYGGLGRETLKILSKDNKVSTSYYSRPGSIARWWLDGSKAPEAWGSWNAPHGQSELRVAQPLPTPRIEMLLKKHQPRLVVVQLGGNMVHQSADEIREHARELVRRIRAGGARCLWIGPNPGDKRPEPQFSNAYKILEEETRRLGCDFVDSRRILTPAPRGGDGVHVDTMKDGKRLARRWAEAVSAETLKALRKSKAAASPGSKDAPSKTRH